MLGQRFQAAVPAHDAGGAGITETHVSSHSPDGFDRTPKITAGVEAVEQKRSDAHRRPARTTGNKSWLDGAGL